MEHECNLQTNKYESKKYSTLNVDMWDNTMIGQYNKTDTDTLEKLSLDRNFKTVKEIEKKEKQGDNKLDELYTQALSNDSDEVFNQNVWVYDSRKSTSELMSPGDILKYYNTMTFVVFEKTKEISVDPNHNPIVILDNGECIPSDTEVKRVKVLVDGVLKEHTGIFRSLDKFKLSKIWPLTTSVEDDQGMLKEVSRIGKRIHKKIESIKDKGYSMTLIHKYR